MKWYQDDAGNTSSIRIMATLAVVVGCLTVMAADVAMFFGIPESVAMAGAGAAMVGAALAAKAWQRKSGG
jgi:uncharacterized membrane protein